MRRLKPLLVTIAATAALAGGGAAIATAATSTSTTATSTSTGGGASDTGTAPARTAPTAPRQGSSDAPPSRPGGSGSHNCPNM
jgi:uncharacterized membrane protein